MKSGQTGMIFVELYIDEKLVEIVGNNVTASLVQKVRQFYCNCVICMYIYMYVCLQYFVLDTNHFYVSMSLNFHFLFFLSVIFS